MYPVDIVEHSIPDYPKIIPNPMDISTIKSKLETDQYLTTQECFNDFDLIWANCIKFNGADAPISNWANKMKKAAQNLTWKIFENEQKVPTRKQEAAAQQGDIKLLRESIA